MLSGWLSKIKWIWNPILAPLFFWRAHQISGHPNLCSWNRSILCSQPLCAGRFLRNIQRTLPVTLGSPVAIVWCVIFEKQQSWGGFGVPKWRVLTANLQRLLHMNKKHAFTVFTPPKKGLPNRMAFVMFQSGWNLVGGWVFWTLASSFLDVCLWLSIPWIHLFCK